MVHVRTAPHADSGERAWREDTPQFCERVADGLVGDVPTRT
jgi:hypothetical protein